jgi:hypothetical protein
LAEAQRQARPRAFALRQEPGRDDRVGPELGLDGAEDALGDVGVLLQERGRVLAALAEALVGEAEVRARLLHELPLEADVEDAALPGDAVAVDDVELGLL